MEDEKRYSHPCNNSKDRESQKTVQILLKFQHYLDRALVQSLHTAYIFMLARYEINQTVPKTVEDYSKRNNWSYMCVGPNELRNRI